MNRKKLSVLLFGSIVGIIFNPFCANAGVVVSIDSELEINSSSLSYRAGTLYTTLNEEFVEVEISPDLLLESLEVLRKTERRIFQISINPNSTSGSTEFIDFPLRGTEVGATFYNLDTGGLSDLLRGYVELPVGSPPHPDDVAQQLLNSDNLFQSLPLQVGLPSNILIGSQTYLTFDPSVPGLVDIQFRPLIILLSVRGQYLEVGETLRSFVEQPYTYFSEDIMSRPLVYREALSSLDRSSAITAAMGLINAACQDMDDCAHLEQQARGVQFFQSLQDSSYEIPSPPVSFSLSEYWRNSSYIIWEPNNSNETWNDVYITVCQVLANLGETKKLLELKSLLNEQFLTYPVPDNDLIQAASAVVWAWNGHIDNAERALSRAVILSEELPDKQFEVANIGLHVSKILRESGYIEKADEIYSGMSELRYQARVRAFDQINQYLVECEEEISVCSLDNLLIMESEAYRAGLFGIGHIFLTRSNWFFDGFAWESIDRDIAWLHGRFAYLIGMKLTNTHSKINRLRYLESSLIDAWPENREFLEGIMERFIQELNM